MAQKPIDWTPKLLRQLLALRASGVSMRFCADELGINHKPVYRKLKELGLNTRIGRGRMSGKRVVRDRE